MLLGELLSRLGDETVALHTLIAIDDLGLLARVRQAAELEDLSAGAWMCKAVDRFANSVDDSQWLGLITACNKASDAGSAALRHMLEAALRDVAKPDQTSRR